MALNGLKGYRFIDLFAGIGGFHTALSESGATCVFASEIDPHACFTYEQNYGLKPKGDITQIPDSDIPPHDILCGGFPCQAFSISGKQKGFEDTRGTLFFDIVRIASHHKPRLLFLENVKNFASHDEGRTLTTVINTLESIGYTVFHQVLDACYYGVPHKRERLYILAFRKDLGVMQFHFPDPVFPSRCVEDILIPDEQAVDFILRPRDDIFMNDSCTFPTQLSDKTVRIGTVNKGGQGERIYHPKGQAITLSAHGGGIGAKTGLYYINGVIRKLTPVECARLQGFSDDFKPHPQIQQAYKQFGNSVAVPVLQAILKQISAENLLSCGELIQKEVA